MGPFLRLWSKWPHSCGSRVNGTIPVALGKWLVSCGYKENGPDSVPPSPTPTAMPVNSSLLSSHPSIMHQYCIWKLFFYLLNGCERINKVLPIATMISYLWTFYIWFCLPRMNVLEFIWLFSGISCIVQQNNSLSVHMWRIKKNGVGWNSVRDHR